MPCLSALIKGGLPASIVSVVPLFGILEVTIVSFGRVKISFVMQKKSYYERESGKEESA